MQFMRCLCSVMQLWQSGFRPRLQSGVRPRGQSSTARAGIWALFRSAFPGVPLPPSPPGCRKNGAALRRRPMRYDTQPFETSRKTSSRYMLLASYSQVTRKFQVYRKFIALRFHVFPKAFHTFSGRSAFSFCDV